MVKEDKEEKVEKKKSYKAQWVEAYEVLEKRMNALEARVEVAESGLDVLREMITEREVIAEIEVPSKEYWEGIGWVKEGLEKNQLHFEKIVPKENDVFGYQGTKVQVYKGKVMEVPSVIANEIRGREAR